MNLQNPFNLPEEWTEKEPWDIINCLKCGNAFKVPEWVFEMFYVNNVGCLVCTLKEASKWREEE